VAEWAWTIAAYLAGENRAAATKCLVQISDDLWAVEPGVAVALTVTPPATTGDAGFDAALAALVEYHLDGRGLPVPAWVHDTFRTTDRWSPLGGDESWLLAETPEAFARRGVLIPAEYFASV
jgi:hypothetical protein